jgi:hypothetical protein
MNTSFQLEKEVQTQMRLKRREKKLRRAMKQEVMAVRRSLKIHASRSTKSAAFKNLCTS